MTHPTTPSTSGRERKRTHQRYPARTLHLIDIENLAGSAVPSLGQVQELRTLYRRRLKPGADDQIVLACNHRAFRTAGFGWLDSRHMVRSGRDGADRELLDVMYYENIAERFARVAIASGDGAFTEEAARLAKLGCRLIVISRRESLSARLALVAHEVIFIDEASHVTLKRLSPRHQAALWPARVLSEAYQSSMHRVEHRLRSRAEWIRLSTRRVSHGAGRLRSDRDAQDL